MIGQCPPLLEVRGALGWSFLILLVLSLCQAGLQIHSFNAPVLREWAPRLAALLFADLIRRVIGACFTIDVGFGPNLSVLNCKSMRVGQMQFQGSEDWGLQSPQ